MIKTLQISKIDTTGGTQIRWHIDDFDVKRYVDDMRNGAKFPPIIVFHDGKTYWLADGFHRLLAAIEFGSKRIKADVKSGTCRQAILYACGANTSHGLPRTNDDKRQAVTMLLSDDEWAKWSDREIAKRCAVGHPLVASVRKDLSGRNSRCHDDGTRKAIRGGKEYETKSRKVPSEPSPAEAFEYDGPEPAKPKAKCAHTRACCLDCGLEFEL